jgi:hypothetical protein
MGAMRGKRIWLAAVAALALFAGTRGHAEAATSARPDIYVDGIKLYFDVTPQVVQGRTLAPMRTILESVGAEVSWEAATRTAVAKKNGVTLRLPIGQRTVTRNGQKVVLDVPATIIGGRTMLPVRFIAEAFGNQVGWSGGEGKVTIDSTAQPKIRVIGADSNLHDEQTQAVYRMLQDGTLLRKIEGDVGLTYQKSIWVLLTNSDQGYQNAIANYGQESKAGTIAQNSDGLSFGSELILPLHRMTAAADQKMTTAHELTHVLLNQNGGERISSWFHEGLAWEVGMDMRYEGQPAVMRGQLEGEMRDDVLQAVQDGTYRPLIGSSAGKLDALGNQAYNAEFQDHLAFDYLVERSGRSKITAYVQAYARGVDLPFQSTFGLTEADFKGQFDSYVKQEVQGTSQGTQIKLSVPAGFQGRFSLLGQNSHTWKEFTLTQGDHTLTFYKDGRVEGLNVLNEYSEDHADANMIYLFVEPGQPVKEQGITSDAGGLAVADAFGRSYYHNAWLFPLDGQNGGQTVFPDTNRIYGVELLDVQAIR